jgi:hypothetical protein
LSLGDEERRKYVFFGANNQKMIYCRVIEKITRRQALAGATTALAIVMHENAGESSSPSDENDRIAEECLKEFQRWKPTMDHMRGMSAQQTYDLIHSNPNVRFLRWQGAKILYERGLVPNTVSVSDEQWTNILKKERENAITPETKAWLEERNKRRKILQKLLSGR